MYNIQNIASLPTFRMKLNHIHNNIHWANSFQDHVAIQQSGLKQMWPQLRIMCNYG